MEINITKHIRIKNNQIKIDGEVVYNMLDISANDFFKSVYRANKLKYLKFFKMDELCKLGFLATELLINNTDILEKYNSDEIALIYANSNSTNYTDTEFYKTIKSNSDFFPSPGLFVYTLPNIIIGEVCIKHKIKGESAFFIQKHYQPEFLIDHINSMFTDNKTRMSIGGWIDFTKNEYDAFLYIAEINKDKYICSHNSDNINKLFNELKRTLVD